MFYCILLNQSKPLSYSNRGTCHLLVHISLHLSFAVNPFYKVSADDKMDWREGCVWIFVLFIFVGFYCPTEEASIDTSAEEMDSLLVSKINNLEKKMDVNLKLMQKQLRREIKRAIRTQKGEIIRKYWSQLHSMELGSSKVLFE